MKYNHEHFLKASQEFEADVDRHLTDYEAVRRDVDSPEAELTRIKSLYRSDPALYYAHHKIITEELSDLSPELRDRVERLIGVITLTDQRIKWREDATKQFNIE